MSVVSFAAGDPRDRSTQWRVRTGHVLLFALVLFAVGNLGRIPFLNLGERQAPILINDLCVGAVLMAGALAMGNARSIRLNDVALAALVFAGIGALSAFAAIPRFGLSWFEVIASLAYLARWLFYFALYVVVINCLRATDVEGTWMMIERVLLFMAVFGMVQAAFLPNFAFIVYPELGPREFDAQRNRLVSTILDPNIMAAMIGVVLLVQLSRMAFGVKVATWKPLLLASALLLTLSRGGLFSFGVGALVILAVKGVTKGFAKLGAIVIGLMLLALPWLIPFANQYARFTFSDDSALARLITWQRAIGAFLESPWFGIGFNTYGFVQEHRGFERLAAQSYSAEGGLLFIAVMTGIVGLAVYLVMLWLVLRRCRRGWLDRRATPSERGLFLGVGAATVAILVDSIFVNSLFMPFVMELLWVMWGLTFVAAASARARRSEGISFAPIASVTQHA